MENYGIIYVLSNPCMKGIVKIGQTKRNEARKRMRDLYYGKTGVPCNFVCECAYRVPLELLDKTEKMLHSYFANKRVNKRREFFRVKPQDVSRIIDFMKLGGVVVDDAIKWELNGELEKTTKEEEKQSGLLVNKQTVQEVIDTEEAKRKAPNMDFLAMGLPIGSVLRFKNDMTVCCTISSHNRVDCQDRHGISLSALTKELLGTPYGVQPSPYWLTEDDRLLIDIYKECTQAHVADAQAQGKASANAAKKTVEAARKLSEKCQQLINDTNHE